MGPHNPAIGTILYGIVLVAFGIGTDQGWVVLVGACLISGGVMFAFGQLLRLAAGV